ncbi:MAG TPA: hypothetical protein VK212_04360 [Lentimicrobium sp.]|nr:hypothetical protein [Lentimicrobium sp.]
MSVKHLVLPVLVLFSMAGCDYLSHNRKEQAVAECYGKYLYKEDLEGLVSAGTTPNDSIAMIRQFIDNWIMQQVMLKQAEDNLNEEQKDFREQIESYRNSLIIFAYESELIRQKLDTVINPAEIEAFYNNNQPDFQLRENIVKVNYVKIPQVNADKELVKKATRLLKSNDEEDIGELSDLCNRSNWICFTEKDQWIRFDDLLAEIPIKTDDQERFLRDQTFLQMSDSLYTYLVNFREYKTKEGVSPLSFETANIRNMILNKRKIELMDRMQQEVYRKAMENKDFTIY